MKYELLSFLERGRGENWGRKLVRPRAEAGQTTKLLICLSEAGGGGGKKIFGRSNYVPETLFQLYGGMQVHPQRNEKNIFPRVLPSSSFFFFFVFRIWLEFKLVKRIIWNPSTLDIQSLSIIHDSFINSRAFVKKMFRQILFTIFALSRLACRYIGLFANGRWTCIRDKAGNGWLY